MYTHSTHKLFCTYFFFFTYMLLENATHAEWNISVAEFLFIAHNVEVFATNYGTEGK